MLNVDKLLCIILIVSTLLHVLHKHTFSEWDQYACCSLHFNFLHKLLENTVLQARLCCSPTPSRKSTVELLHSAHISMIRFIITHLPVGLLGDLFISRCLQSDENHSPYKTCPFLDIKTGRCQVTERKGGHEGPSGQMGAFDIPSSGNIRAYRSEYFVTAAHLSWGHGLKRGSVLWMLPVCLNGLERTLQFVEVSMEMRHGCVKNIPACSSGDLCTDG